METRMFFKIFWKKNLIIFFVEQNLININPSVMGAAKSLLDANGYCMDSPIEKNW